MARMRRGEITNVEHRYEEKTRELEARRGVEVSHRVVGAGVLEVSAAETPQTADRIMLPPNA